MEQLPDPEVEKIVTEPSAEIIESAKLPQQSFMVEIDTEQSHEIIQQVEVAEETVVMVAAEIEQSNEIVEQIEAADEVVMGQAEDAEQSREVIE